MVAATLKAFMADRRTTGITVTAEFNPQN